MVKADMGIMAMAKWALQPYLKSNSIKAIKIGKNGLKRKHYIAYMSNKTIPIIFSILLNFCKPKSTNNGLYN